MKRGNIARCMHCLGTYIDEEYDYHDCTSLSIVVFDSEGRRWGSYDSMNFFALPSFGFKVPTNLQQPDRTPSKRNRTTNVVATTILVTY
jgi:hypothetical protein